ncbi:hypothetical protein PRIPAC_80968 [Pristionchus pacificus]|nr:hypothetical protein PRIPAC_80968 [Pristionchus pacificus]
MKPTLLLLVLVSLADAVVFKAPVHKSASLRAQLIKEGTFSDFLIRQNLACATSASLILSNSAVGKQPFIDYYDDLYTAELSIGTPWQNFTVKVDTAQTDIWVIDIICKTPACRGYAESGYMTQFDMARASTDVMNLGGIVSEVNQGFGLAQEVIDIFEQLPIDGVLGLAWPAQGEVLVNLLLRNNLDKLDASLFTIWLDRRAEPKEAKLGGLISYGALDNEHCDSQVIGCRLRDPLLLSNVLTVPDDSLLNRILLFQCKEVISDTGNAWVGAPASAVDGVAKATSAKYDSLNQMYTVPCKGNSPDMVFTIGGKTFNVPSSEYVIDVSLGNGKCALAIFEVAPAGWGPDWKFGNVWIRTY